MNRLETESLFRALIENHPDFIARFDRECRHTYVNPAITKAFGRPAEFFLGQTICQLGQPADSKKNHPLLAAAQRTLETGMPAQLEVSWTLPAGEIVCEMRLVPEFDARGKVTGLLCITREITKLKETEERQRQGEERFRLAFEFACIGMALLDLDGRWLCANESLCQMLGYTETELQKTTFQELTHPEDLSANQETAQQLRAGKIPFMRAEKRYRHREGHYIWTRLTTSVCRSPEGKPLHYISQIEDITQLKQAQAKVLEVQGRLQFIFDVLPIGICLNQVQGDGRTERLINDAHLNIAGIPRHEDQQASWWNASHPGDREQQTALTRQLEAGMIDRFSMDKRYVRADGETVWVMFSLLRRKLAEGGFEDLTTVVDITERKRMESELREQTNFQSTLLNALNDVGMQLMVVENGRIIHVGNREIAHQFGFTDADIDAHPPLLDIIHPDDRALVMGNYRRRLAGEPVDNSYETGLVTRQGERREYESAVAVVPGTNPVRIVTIGKDITARKQAEAALAYERDLLRTLLNNSSDSIYFKDTQSRFIKSSTAQARQFGVASADALVGKTDFDFFAEEHARTAFEDEQKIILTGEPMIGRVEKEVWLDGRRESWVLTTKMPFRDKDGKIIGTFGISKDITELKQMEERLRQSQKMEVVGRLAGGVAHDFNNLLTVIQGNLELLKEWNEIAGNQEVMTGLSEIARATERATGLTRQLLTFSRRQAFQARPLDLNDIVRETSKMIRRLIGEHISLEIGCAPEAAIIQADCGMMEQVLVNLAVNARDAMSQGGKLVIQVAVLSLAAINVPNDPKVRRGRFVRLTVQDTGCGIAPEHQKHIFEPFFTTKDVGKGTGLGLATVHGIIEQHQGWIEVESTVGVGTTIQVYLPRRQTDDKASQPLIPAKATDVEGGTETILLVEDEASIRRMVRTLLERQKYRVIEAESGISALGIWQQHRSEIQLLITDIVMPDKLSGYELAERLLAEKPVLRVIYCSGYNDDVLGGHSPLRDNPNFLEKPYNPRKLLKLVRDNLDGLKNSGSTS